MKRFRFALIIVVLAAIFHFVPFFNGAETWAVRGIARAGYGLRNAAFSVRGFFVNVSGSDRLARENAALKDENRSLQEKLAAVSALGSENETLKGLLEFRSRTDLAFIPAEVVGSDPDATIRALIIDRGSEEGIRRGDPVIVGNGTLVGKIERVSAGRSTVLLPSDPRSAIGVMLAERPEANGVAQGEKGLVVAMTLIPQHAAVEKNDVVVTTGREQFIPRGLILGAIESVTVVPSDPFMSATIIPAVDAIALTKVVVLHQK